MDPVTEHQQQLRTLRDFLLLYNRLSELCFQHCVCNLNHRLLTGREESCLEGCAGKLVHANHRLLGSYVQLMPALLSRRLAEQGGHPQGDPSPTGAPLEPSEKGGAAGTGR